MRPILSPAAAPPACVEDDTVCRWLWEATGQGWIALGGYFALVPLRVILIVVMALVARHLLHRTINRLVRGTAVGEVPTILKPLRERLPSATPEPHTIFPERRRQRAEAIGSVLRSFVTLSVYSVATLLILGEIGVNLAPLIASVGIAGVALGFGAQTLVKDLITGLFMLLEDQYGVGDSVDLGEASGIVESVGLRVTTVRDLRGVVWYIRNGEIVRVGNRSQGWAVVVIDMPIGFAGVEEAAAVLARAAQQLADDPQWSDVLVEQPQVLGVEQVTVEGAVLRTIVKTSAEAQWRVGRELRRRQAEALEEAGIAARILAARVYPRDAGSGPAQP